jgi:hypothetical protein
MRRIFTVLLGAIVITLGLNSPASAAETPKTIAAKIAKAGLGCKTITEKTKMLFNGNKWVCTANGERVSIEVYPATVWKALQELACSWDYGFIAITDNKTWMVIAESRATSKKLVKPLGGSLKVFCNAKNIYNEKKSAAPVIPKPSATSNPSSTPSPTPTTPVTGTWTKPFALGEGVSDYRFTYTPVQIEQDVTSVTCTQLVEKFAFGWIGDLCPEGDGSGKSTPDPKNLEKYFAILVDIKNNSGEIAIPGSFSVGFALADDQGKIYRPAITEVTSYVEIDIVPNGIKRAVVYFQVPKSFKAQGARLEIRVSSDEWYWAIA